MPTFTPKLLAAATHGRWETGEPARVTGVSIDTRTIREGDLFVAIKGARNGHEFLSDAIGKGASAALVERVVDAAIPQLVVEDTFTALHQLATAHREAYTGKVVGITGSCGKTSTKELVAFLLGEIGVHRTHANLNNQLGVPLTLLEMDAQKHPFAVVEAGMNQVGEMSILGSMIQPDVGIVTMVGAAHLEGVGSLDGVAKEKCALPESVRSDGVCVFPVECLQFSHFRNLDKKIIALRRVGDHTEGIKDTEEVIFDVRQEGTRLILRLAGKDDKTREFGMPLASPGMAQNAALALVAVSYLGVTDAQLQERLSRWQPVAFRGQILRDGETAYYVDCYNANPASMKDTLVAFRNAFPKEAKLYVLGSMNELGENAATLHEEVGQAVKLEEDDQAVLIGPYAKAIKSGMVKAGNMISKIQTCIVTDDAAPMVNNWRGATLLKGSRSYHLEKLLPESFRGGATMPHQTVRQEKEALC